MVSYSYREGFDLVYSLPTDGRWRLVMVGKTLITCDETGKYAPCVPRTGVAPRTNETVVPYWALERMVAIDQLLNMSVGTVE